MSKTEEQQQKALKLANAIISCAYEITDSLQNSEPTEEEMKVIVSQYTDADGNTDWFEVGQHLDNLIAIKVGESVLQLAPGRQIGKGSGPHDEQAYQEWLNQPKQKNLFATEMNTARFSVQWQRRQVGTSRNLLIHQTPFSAEQLDDAFERCGNWKSVASCAREAMLNCLSLDYVLTGHGFLPKRK